MLQVVGLTILWMAGLEPSPRITTVDDHSPPPTIATPLAAAVRMAWWNDSSSGFPTDDNGFTNDLELNGILDLYGHHLALDSRHRMITERHGPHRTDEVQVLLGDRFEQARGALLLYVTPDAGLALSGNYGGAVLQNSFHTLPFIKGRRIGDGLQTSYAGSRAGLVVGGEAGAVWQVHPMLAFHGALAAELAIGETGRHFLLGTAEAIFTLPYWRVRPSVAAGLTTGAYASADTSLAMRGGYVFNRMVVLPHFRACVQVGPFVAGWDVRLNEGGSGTPTGAVFVEWHYDAPGVETTFAPRL